MNFPEFDTQKDTINELVSTLNTINYQVAELLRIKEELEGRLNAFIEHPDEGSKTYIYGKNKVTITSGYNYTLNKEEYEAIGSRLPPCFNPVTQRIAYDLNKTIIRDCEKYGSSEELQLLSQVLSKKAKKLHVKITAAV